MTEPASRSAHTLRLVLVALFGGQLVAFVAVLLLLRRMELVVDIATAHAVAYGWVAVTVVAAVAAYLLAIRSLARGEPVSFGRAVAAAGLADLAAFTGIFAFYIVRVWPMLVVAALSGLLGLAIGMPLARNVADAPGQPEGAEPATEETAPTAGSV